MPELPEVETVRRGLALRMEGRRITRLALNRPDLRTPLPVGLAARVEGRRVVRLGRRAKYLLIHLEDGGVLIAHLGMSGRMVFSAPGNGVAPDPHDHVVFTLEDGSELRFNDARRFGMLDYARDSDLGEHPLFLGLGPEPLGNDFNGPLLAEKLKGKATPIKAALLDQRVVAGLCRAEQRDGSDDVLLEQRGEMVTGDLAEIGRASCRERV